VDLMLPRHCAYDIPIPATNGDIASDSTPDGGRGKGVVRVHEDLLPSLNDTEDVDT